MNLKIFSVCLCLFLGIANVHAANRAEVATKGLATSLFTNAAVYNNDSLPLVRNYETVAFKNKCYKPIAIYVHYLDLNNNWITNGYYRLAPNQKGNIFNTRNTIFYYYAQSMDGTLVWRGDYGFRFHDVIIPMRIVEMSISSWGTFTMSLTCN